MKKVVFEISGRQYVCGIGDSIVIPRFNVLQLNKEYATKCIMLFDEEKQVIDSKDGTVNLFSEKFFLGPKIVYFRKHRRNSRYKKKGHRQKLALVKVIESTV